MPEKMTVPEFAAKIKAKYPVYADMDDNALVTRVVAKYPVYADQVEFEPRPQEKGFVESLFAPLDVKGPGEALQNIGETAGMVGRAISGRPSAAQDITKLSQGISEFAAGTTIGLLKSAQKLSQAIQPGGAAAVASDPEEAFSLISAKEFSESARQAGRYNYRGAAGSAFAGAAMLLPFLRGKGKAAGGVAKTLQEEGGKISLASGKTVPATVGTKFPGGLAARTESVVGGLPGGRALRTAREAEQATSKSLIKTILQRTSQEAGVPAKVLPETPADSFRFVGREFREHASPIYEDLKSLMREGAATQPEINRLAAWAEKELADTQVGNILGKNTEVMPIIQEDLKRLAAFKHGITPESVATAFDSSVYDVVRTTRSNLLSLRRGGRLNANERRIVSEAVEELDRATYQALEKSGGKKAAEMYRTANQLTSQGYALDEIAKSMRKATKGTSESAQVSLRGADIQKQKLAGKSLVESLEDLARSESPRRPSTLERAIPSEADRQSLRQIAEILRRSEQAGGEGIASKFGILAAIGGIGAPVGAAAGFALGGGTGAVLGGLAGPILSVGSTEVGAMMVARVMSSPRGVGIALDFLKAVPGTPREFAAATRLVSFAQGEK